MLKIDLKELNERDLLLINGGSITPEEAGRAVGRGIGIAIGSVLVAVHIVTEMIIEH
ncbi:MAG: hypothetical protein ABJP86_12960 [Flavobacteriaceae bacterium]